jgi:hypothetical protein
LQIIHPGDAESDDNNIEDAVTAKPLGPETDQDISWDDIAYSLDETLGMLMNPII